MVTLRPTARARELAEVTPLTLDCGHRYPPGSVMVSYEPHPLEPGVRLRTYHCRDCGDVTYAEG